MQSLFCSLCFVPCDLSELIEEDVWESLAQLLPHCDVKTRSDSQVACTDCSRRLKRYLDFKSNFFQTQTRVQSLDTECSGGLLDLRQMYLRNRRFGIEASDVTCHFCLKQATGAYTRLGEDQTELILVTIMMDKCFPELDLGTMSGCVICVPCYETLEASYNSITSWDVENLVKEAEGVAKMEFEAGTDLKPMLIQWERFAIGNDYVDLNASQNAFEDSEKYEEPKVATVDVKEHSLISFKDDDCVIVEQVENEGRPVTHDKSEKDVETKDEDVDVEEHSLSSFEDEVCDVRVQQVGSESLCASASSIRSKRIHKCDRCTYESSYKKNYDRHMLVHKSPSEINMYACSVCPYKAKLREYLIRHMLSHKNRSEVTMYKCKTCPYETKYKQSLMEHVLNHRNLSEVPLYKCEACSYETRQKRNYNRHIVIHSVTTYNCDSCTFSTRHKGRLFLHELHHKPSKESTYKCEACSYETSNKQQHHRHILTHKNVTMYKRYAHNTRRNHLAYLSEIRKYKCEICSYESKQKGHYNQHMLVHKNPSEVTMYKCSFCAYETKHKRNIARHEQLHKELSEVAIHKCKVCPYESKHKRNYNQHILIHKKHFEPMGTRARTALTRRSARLA